ncbi:MAG: CotH kinase family protein, partial [Limisphaerales bacterium]
AGRAFVELFADDSAMQRGLRKAQAKLQAFGAIVRGIGAGMATAGASVLAPLAAMTTAFVKQGSALTDIAARTGMSVEAAERWLDVDGYLRWLAVAVFVGNRDGFVHNYALLLDRVTDRFRIIPWDYDATWGIDIHGRPARLDRVPLTGWNKLTHRLLSVRSYRKRYRSILVDLMEGPAAPDRIGERIDRMRAEVEGWIDKTPHFIVDQGGFEAAVRSLNEWGRARRDLLAS